MLAGKNESLQALRRSRQELVEWELGTPEPGPGEALLRISHAGVNFTDIYTRQGVYRLPDLSQPTAFRPRHGGRGRSRRPVWEMSRRKTVLLIV